MNFARRSPGFTPARSRSRYAALPSGLLLLCLLTLAACSSPRSIQPANSRSFQFESDTLAYANELVWEYYYDEGGEWQHRKNPEEPDYTHHCFVSVRSVRQFFQHARFDATAPRVDEAAYRRKISETIGRDPARDRPDSERIIIPGYPDLRTFSRAHEMLLKETCGGAWQSYFQRGHWRMVLPFSRKGQEAEAEALAASIRNNRPPAVHVVTFPKILINHALLLYDVREEGNVLRFVAYDPNQPEAPTILAFDRVTKQFEFPSTDYWRGGKLNVYEIYRAWNY